MTPRDRIPPLAAMLLSKLKNGAMGAAGIEIPDQPTRDAWLAATTAQAEGAETWTVSRLTHSNASIQSASIVRRVTPRTPKTDAPLYRLTVTCDGANRHGELLLTWSPEPQTDRTFLISVDSQPGIVHTLAGREKMGNGSAGVSGRASATLRVPLPAAIAVGQRPVRR